MPSAYFCAEQKENWWGCPEDCSPLSSIPFLNPTSQTLEFLLDTHHLNWLQQNIILQFSPHSAGELPMPGFILKLFCLRTRLISWLKTHMFVNKELFGSLRIVTKRKTPKVFKAANNYQLLWCLSAFISQHLRAPYKCNWWNLEGTELSVSTSDAVIPPADITAQPQPSVPMTDTCSAGPSCWDGTDEGTEDPFRVRCSYQNRTQWETVTNNWL